MNDIVITDILQLLTAILGVVGAVITIISSFVSNNKKETKNRSSQTIQISGNLDDNSQQITQNINNITINEENTYNTIKISSKQKTITQDNKFGLICLTIFVIFILLLIASKFLYQYVWISELLMSISTIIFLIFTVHQNRVSAQSAKIKIIIRNIVLMVSPVIIIYMYKLTLSQNEIQQVSATILDSSKIVIYDVFLSPEKTLYSFIFVLNIIIIYLNALILTTIQFLFIIPPKTEFAKVNNLIDNITRFWFLPVLLSALPMLLYVIKSLMPELS